MLNLAVAVLSVNFFLLLCTFLRIYLCFLCVRYFRGAFSFFVFHLLWKSTKILSLRVFMLMCSVCCFTYAIYFAALVLTLSALYARDMVMCVRY